MTGGKRHTMCGTHPRSSAALVALAVTCVLSEASVGAAPNSVTATLAEGPLAGVARDGVSVFLGIPYAAAPTGAARWAPTQPALIHSTIRPADTFGASCPQPSSGKLDDAFAMWSTEYLTPTPPAANEDCLFANVWTPAVPRGHLPARLPVLLFLHGGAYISGSGSVPIYDGTNLARKGLVVVTINYRLGAAGFMASPGLSAEQGGASGNYGLQDQIEALRWLRRNVAAFGGDPAKITVVGQSAGAGSALALLSAPAAKGLFRAAVIQSVPLQGNFRALAQAEQTGAASLHDWGVADIAQARALPIETLVKPLPGPPLRFLPLADGHVVPVGAEQAPLLSRIPVMVGYTLNDLFVPNRKVEARAWQREASQRYGRDAANFLRLYPGRTNVEATRSAAREATARVEMPSILKWMQDHRVTTPVYAYLFSHVEPGPRSADFGAFHSSELPYEFDTLDRSPGRVFTAVDRRVTAQFSGAIVNFVKTLSPGGGILPAWPALNAKGKRIMEFSDHAKISRMAPEGADAMLARGKPDLAAPMP